MKNCRCHCRPPARRARPFIKMPQPPSQGFQGRYTPQEIKKAYGFSSGADGSGQTIAVVAASGQPNIASDLSIFSRYFGLPEAEVTVEQIGQAPAAPDPDWALEISMDMEWAHALAPGAGLMLVVSASDRIGDLIQAVDRALVLGADVVSMSWGEDEFPGETALDRVFQNHPETVFVAASGDVGGVPVYPSVSPLVRSAGGSTLQLGASGERLSETAWPSGGCGPSLYFSIPGFQQRMSGISTLTGGRRGTPDVVFCGDPSHGVAVYHSIPYQGSTGWGIAGGSSLAAPCWSALAAAARQSGRAFSPDTLYRLAGGDAYRIPQPYFYDITEGSSGPYQALPGWDLCTGLGSPRADALINGLPRAGL